MKVTKSLDLFVYLLATSFKKFLTDFDEIFRIVGNDIRNNRLNCGDDLVKVCFCQCLFVCLSVSNITQKVINGF